MTYTYDGYDHAHGRNDYKITESGTAYHLETPDDLVQVLEQLRNDGTRIRIDFGDVATGKSWQEEYDTTGTLGRSFGGKFNVPLLIHNRRSMGGGALLDHCILEISHSNKKHGGTIYRRKVTA